MPVIQHTNLNQNTVLAVWKITESREDLLSLFTGHITDAGPNRHDNLHWLASRLLIEHLFAGLQVVLSKDTFNKPSLEVNGEPCFISITHSFAYAAILVSTQTQVAIDMEKIDERVLRVSRKFIREDERYEGVDIAERYTLIWSAKETLYKLHGSKELDFIEHMRITGDSKSELIGEVLKPGYNFRALIHMDTVEDYIITYSMAN